MPVFYASIVACMLAQLIVLSAEKVDAAFQAAPSIVALVAGVRMLWWMQRRKLPFTYEQARSSLTQAKYILSASAAAIIAVDVFVYRSVSPLAQSFLLFQLFGGTMTGVYCLMHVRSAAYIMVCGLTLAFAAILPFMPAPIALGFGVAITALTTTMILSMRGYYQDFISTMNATEAARKLSDENYRLANLDTLTELPNRRQFFHDLHEHCRRGRESGARVAVAIADLDGFKPINDTHGHIAGDNVLRIVAGRIAEAPEFHAYRLAGDEFALISRADMGDAELILAAEAVIASIKLPIATADLIVGTGCSIGVATFPDMAQTPELLYERADYALYHAKRSGRNMALLFTHEHEQQLRKQGEIEQALRNADIAREFYLMFQPIVGSVRGEVVGFECLARWSSPAIGEVSPGMFIPVAEQSGLIANLTPFLLRKALAEAASWPKNLRLSFNLSPHDVASRERVLTIIGIIGQSGIDPRRLDLELTETALLQNFELACENMIMLKAAGPQISLDDFGTGYSSLSHIHRLPLDKVKIDRSFVKNLESGASGLTIVRSVMTLCRDLNLTCIVEGVETDDQLDTLNELGCEQVQGFYFARPMVAKEIGAYLSAHGDGARAA